MKSIIDSTKLNYIDYRGFFDQFVGEKMFESQQRVLQLAVFEQMSKPLTTISFDDSEYREEWIDHEGINEDEYEKDFFILINCLTSAYLPIKTSNGELIMMSLFESAELCESKDKYSVKLNLPSDQGTREFIRTVFDKLKGFDIRIYDYLKSKYSRELYILLVLYGKEAPFCYMDAKAFRNLMGCPKGYDNGKFTSKCLKPALDDILRIDRGAHDISVTPIADTEKRGLPVKSYELHFVCKENNDEK